MASTDLLPQAIMAHQSGNLAEAEKLYLHVLHEDPSRADARFNLGMIYGQLGRPADAVREISLAVQAKPDFGQGWFMLCEFADAIDAHELNRFAGEHATRLMPDDARAWFRYGIVLSRMEREEEAVKAYRRAVEIDPTFVKAWVNLSVAHKALGQFAEAETCIRKAITAAGETIPDETTREADESTYSYLFWYLALLELTLGRYPEGFAHFRARFQGGTNWHRFESKKTLWRGEDLHGKTILVTIEQGFGDALMLCRYLPLLKDGGARVLFQVHAPLVPLFTDWDGADEVIAYGNPIESDYDYHTAIFDLPHRFETRVEAIPAWVPYLPLPTPDEETELPEGGPKIGVVWAGQPDNIRGKNRSIPLELFSKIFTGSNALFFSLTRDKREGDAELLKQCPVTDLGPLLTDFAVTARIINQLDLVITCDTGVAHLAGGMGKPVWVLLPFVADWRWGTEGEKSLWYPTMRLFRQTKRDKWDDVVKKVKEELARFSLSL